MRSVYDVDVILLLATQMASKRRPAELAEIVAGVELVQGLQGTLPSVAKLRAAFSRLAMHGLVKAEGEGFMPTSTAQELCAAATRKKTYAERVAGVRERLAATDLADRHPDIQIEDAQWSAAIAAHRAAAEGAGRNELVPKPKADDARKRPGIGASTGPGLGQRKPLPARRRKD
ncbi:MAG: hypothetical protein L6Q60_09850 [Rhodocyclaceae bacterium]|nr:hypothetical protein [Rhodocyclaceae bacterium]